MIGRRGNRERGREGGESRPGALDDGDWGSSAKPQGPGEHPLLTPAAPAGQTPHPCWSSWHPALVIPLHPESVQVQGSRGHSGWRRPPAPGLSTPLHRNHTLIKRARHTQETPDEEKTGSENPGILPKSYFKKVGRQDTAKALLPAKGWQAPGHFPAPGSSAPMTPPTPTRRGSGCRPACCGRNGSQQPSQDGLLSCRGCILPRHLGP